MSNAKFTALVVIGLLFVGIGLSAFTVNERELAIKLQVGQVVRADYEPGLHWKLPPLTKTHESRTLSPASATPSLMWFGVPSAFTSPSAPSTTVSPAASMLIWPPPSDTSLLMKNVGF